MRALPVLLVLCGCAAALAAPAPGSLRVARQGSVVRLTWQAGDGLYYAVYRSPDADDVLRPAWLVEATRDLFYEEPAAAGPSPITYYLVADPLPCTANTDCDNHRPCDGAEVCSARERICRAGVPVDCNDGDACTGDVCDDATGQCTNAVLDCEDGDPCTLDVCRAGFGCYAIVDPASGIGTPAELAGRTLPGFPHVDHVEAFHAGTTVDVALDPFARPGTAGRTCDVYVVADRSAAEWCASPLLADVRGAPETRTFAGPDTRSNTFPLTGSATLDADAGTALGRGYDVALDCNRNGALDAGELADGLEDGAGFYVVRDLTGAGPLDVTTFDDLGPEPPHCSGGGNDDMRIYYPTVVHEPGFVGTFPLVMISHGNGHCFDWYDFLGTHLASYGYVVVSHDNDTGPGIESASRTTLEFTDRILLRQADILGGALNGHIDARRITWIGHSRGGEGITRAYDRLAEEGYPAQRYSADDIALMSSIAPTDFLGPARSDPKSIPYHLLYGSSDGDVCGCPDNPVAQSFGLYERARGARQSTYVHGADHNDFNCCGFDDFSGPSGTAIGRAEAQRVQKIVQLAVIKHTLEGSPAAKEILSRQWETFLPLGVAPSTVVVNELRELPGRRAFVIDDYQTQPATGTSSSGGAVTWSAVAALAEDRLREINGTYEWTGTETMNGMTRGRLEDVGRGAGFEFNGGTPWYELELVPASRDVSAADLLSFRAAQVTRSPRTTARLEDLTFTVTLRDAAGRTASIDIGVFGGGLEEPYQRGGYGPGAGWQDEFETIRVRLADFTRDGTNLDLTNIVAVRFEFARGETSREGRIVIDDVELVKP